MWVLIGVVSEQFILFFGDNNYRPFFKMILYTSYSKFVAFLLHPLPCAFDWILMLIRYLIKPSLWVFLR